MNPAPIVTSFPDLSDWCFEFEGETSNLLGDENPTPPKRNELYDLSGGRPKFFADLPARGEWALHFFHIGDETSIVVVCRRPAEGNTYRAALCTEDGSLEAWLLRYDVLFPQSERGFEECVGDFLRSTPPQRRANRNALPLTGTVEVVSASGRLRRVTLDLRTESPAPLHQRYFDNLRDFYAGPYVRAEKPFGPNFPKTWGEYLKQRAVREDQLPATIRGVFHGYKYRGRPWWFI